MGPSSIDPLMTSALVLGAFGSVHCLTMCGGIAGALGQAVDPNPSFVQILRLSLYSLGRISSYSVAGAGVGFAGETFAAWTGLSILLRVVAGLLILAFGLHVAGWWNGLAAVERIGMRAWRRLAPIARRLGRPDTSWKVFALGLLWGWLPCGLVYSALLGAASTGSMLSGAGFMACFGFGTLPAMWAASGFGARLGSILARRSSRRAAGLLLIAFGVGAILGATMPLIHSSPSDASPHSTHMSTTHDH